MLRLLSDSFRSSKSQARRRQFQKLRFEPLEDRRLLATFTVTNTSDAAVTMAGDLPGSLRQAIFDANANPGDDTIEFDSSVFTGGSASLIGLTAGELEITDTLTIADSLQNEVTIDAQGNSRVLKFSGFEDDLTLEGLTLTGGKTTGPNTSFSQNYFSGGGIQFLSYGTLSMISITLNDNHTLGNNADGGGIFTEAGNVALTNSTLSNNSTAGSGADGGGIFTDSGAVMLVGSTLSGNTTSGDFATGGGIYADNADVMLISSSLTGNSTTGDRADGGGIYSDGDLTLTDSTVSGNSTIGFNAPGGGVLGRDVQLYNSSVNGNSTAGRDSSGGGISGGIVQLFGSSISNNSTAGTDSNGGGVAGGEVALTDSTSNHNSTTGWAARGGGIAGVGKITLTDSTVSGNSTMGNRADGGGIAATYTFADVELTNSTVSNNRTLGDDARGGGIFASQFATISDSRVYRNSTSGSDALGGGIFANFPRLTNSTVSNNSTSGDGAHGGGIFGDVTQLWSSTVSGNSTTGNSATGGGVHADDGFVTLRNSTVSGNSTTGNSADGGGIFAARGPVNLTGSTVTGNVAEAAAGGGIYFSDFIGATSFSVLTSIVAGNTDNGTVPDLRGDISSPVTVDHSLIGDTTGSRITNSTGFGNLLNVDPQLLPLAFNGGATKTHALLPESPAIDASPSPVPLQEYELNGSFVDSQGNAPDLVSFGGAFVNNVRYDFEADQGLEAQIPAENSSNYSIELKFRFDSWSDQKVLDFNLGESAEGLYMNGRKLVYRTGESTTFSTPNLFLPNSPHPSSNITLTRSDSSPLTVYLDGELFHTFPTQTPAGNAIGVFNNGANASDTVSARFFMDHRESQSSGPGYVDFIRIYDRALTAEEVSGRLLYATQPRFDQRLRPRPLGSGFDIGAFEFDPNDQTLPPTVTATVRDVGGVLARPDLLSTFSVSFDADVNVSADDLLIRNDTLGGDVVDSSVVSLEYDATTHTATWDFAGLILDPAFYSFELSSNIVSVAGNLSVDGDLDGNPGGAFVESVYVALPGDANLDGQVNVLQDAFALVGNLGTTGGATWAQGDFNGDGNVNVLGDAFILVGRLGHSVVPPATATSTSSASGFPNVAVTTQAASTNIAFSPQPASFVTEEQDDRSSNERSTPPEQLVLAGSEELDATFESDSLFDDGLLFV